MKDNQPALRRSRRPMIYLDASVAVANLMAEDGQPPDGLWAETLVSSRLIEYDLWNRLNARVLARSHGAETAVSVEQEISGHTYPQDRHVVFHTDHPFLYLIRDDKTGVIYSWAGWRFRDDLMTSPDHGRRHGMTQCCSVTLPCPST